MLIKNVVAFNSLTIFGFLLILGVIGGHFANATRFFPKITGYILIGLIFGPNLLGVISQPLLNETRVFSDIAIGLVLFQLGLQINISYLKQDINLLLTGITESIFTFVIIFGTLYYFHISWLLAALAAAIGISSSPALTLILSNKDGTVGEVTQRSYMLVAINNILAFCFFIFLLPLLQLTVNQSSYKIYMIILEPLYRLGGPLLLATILGYSMLAVVRLIGKKESAQFSLLVGMLIMSIGISKMLDLSPILTPLLLGIIIVNIDKKNDMMQIELGHSGDIFFILLFVLTGAKLHISQLISVGWIAVAFVAARLIGKFTPVFLLSRLNGLSHTQSYALGLTLFPLAGTAIGLLNSAMDVSNEYVSVLSAIILASVAIIEITTPLITIFALRKAGELTPSTQLGH